LLILAVLAVPVFAQVDLQSTILANERAELECLRKGDVKAFADFLADDAVFVDAHGAASKAVVVKNVSDFHLQEFTIEDVRLVPLSSKSGILIYTITESGTSHGKTFSAKVHISATWVDRDGKWVCLFGQETREK
jgi:ketosteroid isomerase-like protein